MKITSRQLRSLIKEEIDKIRTSGDATREEDSFVLTDDYSQSGTISLDKSIDLSLGFRLSFDFQIIDSEGTEDLDGPGGDGIFVDIEFDDGKLQVAYDTFKNWENESGNEVNVKFNGNVLVAGPVEQRMNNVVDNETHRAVITCENELLTAELDDVVIVACPLHDIINSGNDLSGGRVKISGLTGDAMGIHIVSNVDLT